MDKLQGLMSQLPPELLEEGSTGRDLIDAIIDETKKLGMEEGVRLYAWWQNGVEFVGCGKKTLVEALRAIRKGG